MAWGWGMILNSEFYCLRFRDDFEFGVLWFKVKLGFRDVRVRNSL